MRGYARNAAMISSLSSWVMGLAILSPLHYISPKITKAKLTRAFAVNRPVVVFVSAPQSHVDEGAGWQGRLAACVGLPVHLLPFKAALRRFT
jgi:hypothetical protein